MEGNVEIFVRALDAHRGPIILQICHFQSHRCLSRDVAFFFTYRVNPYSLISKSVEIAQKQCTKATSVFGKSNFA